MILGLITQVLQNMIGHHKKAKYNNIYKHVFYIYTRDVVTY